MRTDMPTAPDGFSDDMECLHCARSLPLLWVHITTGVCVICAPEIRRRIRHAITTR